LEIHLINSEYDFPPPPLPPKKETENEAVLYGLKAVIFLQELMS